MGGYTTGPDGKPVWREEARPAGGGGSFVSKAERSRPGAPSPAPSRPAASSSGGGFGSSLGTTLAASFGGRGTSPSRPDAGWDGARAGVGAVAGIASAFNPTIGSIVGEVGGGVTSFLQGMFGR